jgi:hypothetical protein
MAIGIAQHVNIPMITAISTFVIFVVDKEAAFKGKTTAM